MGLLTEKCLADPDIQEHPVDYYHALHEHPIYYDAHLRFFICSTYRLMREILRDTETFSNVGSQTLDDLKPPPREAIEIRRQGWAMANTLVTNDPPAHTRIRTMMDAPFRPRSIETRVAAIRNIVSQTIERFIDARRCEVVRDFAVPIPITVIADMLGLPREMAPKLKEWSDASVEPLGMMITDQRQIECARLFVEFQQYFVAQLRSREREPRDDLLTHVALTRDATGTSLSLEEQLSVCSQLLVAGNETTTNGLAAGVQLLIEHPDQLALLVEDDDVDYRRARTFANEVLRLQAPVQGLFRIVRRDVELAGVAIPKGSRIMLRFAAANRDPERFNDPDTLDICRHNAGAHLAFGAGIHHCIGANLAREEMTQAFHILVRRAHHFAFVSGMNDFGHHPSMLLRGLKALHVSFDKIA
jgi:cytochrome P450